MVNRHFYCIWLNPRAGKMKWILPLDWLPKCHLTHLGFPALVPQRIYLFGHIINPLLTKLVQSRWLDIGLVLSCIFIVELHTYTTTHEWSPIPKKIWLSIPPKILVITWPYTCPPIRNTEKPMWNVKFSSKCGSLLPLFNLIIDIHIMVNWQVSQHGIRWPVSHDRIAGLGANLLRSREVFHWPVVSF